VVRDIAYSRQAARWAAPSLPARLPAAQQYGETPSTIVIAGGDSSVEKMIAPPGAAFW